MSSTNWLDELIPGEVVVVEWHRFSNARDVVPGLFLSMTLHTTEDTVTVSTKHGKPAVFNRNDGTRDGCYDRLHEPTPENLANDTD